MPHTRIVFYKDDDGSVPAFDWLYGDIARRDRRIVAKCRAAIRLLEQEGIRLRRPTADYLRDGIYELRIHFGSVNYRMLYFFQGATIAILTQGLTKEKEVPDKEIALAIKRKAIYESDPERHSHEKTFD